MLEIPTHCPDCNSELERVNNQLFCRNVSCGAQNLEKLKKFAKTMKIMGLGEKTIEKLDLANIEEIYYLDEEFVREVLGNKIADKLLREIRQSQTIKLSTFLQSMSIPLIGSTASKKIAKVWAKVSLYDMEMPDLLEGGLGEKAATNFIKWLNDEWFEGLDNLPITYLYEEDVPKSTMTICISGKTPGYTKAQIADILEKHGITTANTVSSKIQYLISESTTTAKAKKALELNIPIMGFDKFLKENVNNEPEME